MGLTLPAGLVSVAARLGARLVPSPTGTDDLIAQLERGDMLAPVVVDDVENAERVEISIEG